MAEEKNNEPLAALTDEARANLEKVKTEIEASEQALAALKELGVDVSRLEERITWAKKARETILKTFK